MPPAAFAARFRIAEPRYAARWLVPTFDMDTQDAASMAHINKVLSSINDEGEDRCVDIFVRPDGTFGFEEFRRDVEDLRGWFPIGGYSGRVYADEPAARHAAIASVPWLSGKIG